MPVYQYSAMDAQGKEKKGRLQADNENDANAKLKEQGLFPTSISVARGTDSRAAGGGAAKTKRKKYGGAGGIVIGTPKIKRKSLTTFTRQLATLLEAGLPLVRGLRTLERQAKDIAEKRVIGDIADGVEGGMTFSEALASQPKTFDRLFVNMVRAGEASGGMEQVLAKLAEYMEKAARLKSKVKAALVYPVVVLTIALTITAGLLIFIVPKFARMFTEMLGGEALPMITRIVMAVSDVLVKRFWIGGIIIISVVLAFVGFKKTKFGSYFLDMLAIKMPPFGTLVTKSSVARFCSTLGTLMESGVSVLNALQIVRDTSGNELLARAVQVVHDAVKEGESMAKPLDSTNVFPVMVVSMVQVGEETGALPEMLNRIAKVYAEEVDLAVDSLTSLIEPMMIVMLGGLVGTIVLAMFMPLIKLIERIGG